MKTVILKPALAITNSYIFHILRIYRGLTCSDRSGTLINRKYCFLRIDIDAQNFPRDGLVIKLASSEVGVVVKSWIFLVFPYRTLI